MTFKQTLQVFAITFAILAVSSTVAREWTAQSGHKITGDFVSVQDGIVKISQPEGFVAEIPLDQLSEECQKFVETQIEKKDDNPFVIRREVSIPTTPTNQFQLTTEAASCHVSAISSIDGLPLCWISSRDGVIMHSEGVRISSPSGEITYRLSEGASFTFGEFKATIKKIDAETGSIQVEVARSLYTIRRGSSFAEAKNNAPLAQQSTIPASSVKLGYTTPRNILEQEAQKDNPEALFYLATFYMDGLNGFSKDEKRAEELSRKGAQFADTGNPAAQCCRARCYYNGWGELKDLTESVKWYRLAAEQGYAPGQFRLGARYAEGTGVRQDMTEAVKWFRLAAEQGDAPAQATLGAAYYDGEGVTKNLAEAVKWYRKAAEQGDATAQFYLGICYANGEGVRKDMSEAVKWYHKAAEQENALAQFNLGACYENGEGVRKDMSEAVKWYRKSAEQGFVVAQVGLGAKYYDGDDVPKNSTEAVKWFRLAADQEHELAQYSLGLCYEGGEGVRKDMSEAVKWYRKSADQGFAQAQCNLGGCYALGEGVRKDMTEAAKWWRKAADQGLADAQFKLGACYAMGEGVPESESESEKWMRKAADQGWEPAQEILRTVAANRQSQAARAQADTWSNWQPVNRLDRQTQSRIQNIIAGTIDGHINANATRRINNEIANEIRSGKVQYRTNNSGVYQVTCTYCDFLLYPNGNVEWQ